MFCLFFKFLPVLFDFIGFGGTGLITLILAYIARIFSSLSFFSSASESSFFLASTFFVRYYSNAEV
jgi:hypothetical protein